MEWKKAKTILIWLFIVIDICLLAYNIYLNFGNNRVQLEELSPILKENNIVISEDISAKNRKSVFVHEYKSAEITDELKDVLLGSYDEISKGRYISKDKKIVLKTDNNEFFYENKSPDFSDFNKLKEKNAEKILKKYLKLLGVSEYAKLEEIKTDDEKITVNYSFEINGLEIFSSDLIFVISQKGIHKMYGTLNVPNIETGYEFELSNIETIFLNFSRNNKNSSEVKIEQLKLGCYLSDYENAVTSQALPAYMIKTNDKIYIYDARDGVDSSQRQLAIK